MFFRLIARRILIPHNYQIKLFFLIHEFILVQSHILRLANKYRLETIVCK